MSCPCGSGRELMACCGRFVMGGQNASTAEQLMRSRYTAYVMRNIDYLVATHDPGTHDIHLRASVEQWAAEATWLGLEVVSTQGGGEDSDDGIVEFRARYRMAGQEHEHHERSVFQRRRGQWLYVSGSRPRAASVPKAKPNEPCPCGSGKKHKKCCGAMGKV